MRKNSSFVKNKSIKTIIIVSALSLLSSFIAYSADIKDFQTDEYYASNGLDIINAAEAYSKGYTGKGITIGINDLPVNLEHESFADKTGSKYIGSLELDDIDWGESDHGTHVGGIAAGSKNGKGMHGVAFDADIVSTCFLEEDLDFPKFDYYPEVKIINNSWGGDVSVDNYFLPDQIEDDLSSDKVLEKLYNDFEQEGYIDQISPINETASKNRLLVFANCNYGQPETSFIPFFQWLNNENVNNLISVTTALNSFANYTHLERNCNGSITGDFINASSSNLAKYCEDSIISAPGWNINSSLATDNDKYVKMSGTSMAAPFVTGGAALVQQAFPYMNSKQIGDVLLSTANNNISLQHSFGVLDSFNQRYDDKGNPVYDDNGKPVYDFYAKLFYLDGRTHSSDEQIKNDLLTYSNSIKNDMEDGPTDAYVINNAIEQGNILVYYQTPIQEFVGQGILDVGKAVSGPGALNARRLEKDNISNKYLTDGQQTVMYDIDTKGYDSCWDNDIKEIRAGKIADCNTEEDLRERYNYYNQNWLSNDKADKWSKALTKAYVDEFNNRVDESGLEGLHVGLIKSGEGILKLNGNNTYQGPTVVTEGAIAVNGSVAGDAYSEDKGVIMGKGRINGTLYNNNIAIAGDGGKGDLSMGALESKGLLVSSVDNGENSKFIVDGKANIDGSTLVVDGLNPGESCTILTAGSITGELTNSKNNTSEMSGFLKEYAKIENNEVKYVFDFSPNFEGVSPKQAKAFEAIKNMYFNLLSGYQEDNSPLRPALRAVTTPQQMAQINAFIALPAAQAGSALKAVTLNAAAQSMSFVQRNSFVGDILSSHFADRFAKASSQVEPLDNSAWFKFSYNKGQMRDGARYRGRSGIIGYDLKLTDTKSYGLFFGHGNNTLDGFNDAWAKNRIEENRFGFYSSNKNDKYSGYLFLDYGKVDNELKRHLTNLGLSTNVEYKGKLFELGGEYKLNLNSQKNKAWKVNPYVNVLYSKYDQGGYAEKDGGIFNHVVESKTKNYADGQLGLEFAFSNDTENYVLRLAGKHAFSGEAPELTYSFEGDMANKYSLDNEQDKNHLLVSFKGERKISTNAFLSADFSMQRGSHDRDMKASLSFWKKF